jgi:hypothetical protein
VQELPHFVRTRHEVVDLFLDVLFANVHSAE